MGRTTGIPALLRAFVLLLPLAALAAEDGLDEGLDPAYLERLRRAGIKTEARIHQERIDEYLGKLARDGNPDSVHSLMHMKLTTSEALAVFTPMLAHENPWIPQLALHALGDHGPAVVAVLPQVLAIAGDTKRPPYLQAEAIGTAGKVAPGHAEVLQCIARVLAARSWRETTLAALAAAEHSGAAAIGLLPAVQGHLNDADLDVAYAAWLAAGAIRAAAQPAWSALSAAGPGPFLGDDGVAAFATLSQVDPASDTRALLVDILRAPAAPAVHLHAVKLLAERTPTGAAAVQVLATACTSELSELADAAADALDRIQVDDPATIDALVEVLLKLHPKSQEPAARALGRSGAHAARVVPAVRLVLDQATGDLPCDVVGGCLDALRAAGVAAVPATATVRTLLAETAQVHAGRPAREIEDIRAYALLVLIDLGIDESVLPVVLDLLANGQHFKSRAIASRAAGALGAAAAASVPLLAQPLAADFSDFVFSLERFGWFYGEPPPHTTLRIEAIRALIRIGAAARPLVPLLRQRVDDEVSSSDDELLHYQAEAERAVELLAR